MMRVSFFTQQPQKGTKNHMLEWNGAIWLFVSADNKVLFSGNPEKYAPQYGGYCAWLMAQNGGKFAKGDPKFWKCYHGQTLS